jgi:hypothetical protein
MVPFLRSIALSLPFQRCRSCAVSSTSVSVPSRHTATSIKTTHTYRAGIAVDKAQMNVNTASLRSAHQRLVKTPLPKVLWCETKMIPGYQMSIQDQRLNVTSLSRLPSPLRHSHPYCNLGRHATGSAFPLDLFRDRPWGPCLLLLSPVAPGRNRIYIEPRLCEILLEIWSA